MKQLLDYLSRLGSTYKLTFSGHLILKDYIIGLDGVQRKLLVLRGIAHEKPEHYLIDLNEVDSCTIKMHYGHISVNGLKQRKLEQYLEKMSLHFKFLRSAVPADIVFYKRPDNLVSELPELEQKAKKWKELLSKMLSAPPANLV
jgi:hypothetical protein